MGQNVYLPPLVLDYSFGMPLWVRHSLEGTNVKQATGEVNGSVRVSDFAASGTDLDIALCNVKDHRVTGYTGFKCRVSSGLRSATTLSRASLLQHRFHARK